MRSLINNIFGIALIIAIAATFYFKPVEPKQSELTPTCERYGLEHEAIIQPNEKTKQIIIQCR